MKRLFVIALLLVVLAGCDGVVIDLGDVKPLVPTPDRPPRAHIRNTSRGFLA